ncbi:MAG TPA: hypothetical protein VEQ65_07525 [Opitutus sp.]|nr:hypothetical protein [Opitutus sp.]
MTGELPSKIVAEIAFIGRGGGAVKSLGGFRKGHHTVPDAANDVTNAFLGKICAGELTAEAEALFQAVRAGLGYKRKDVSLTLASPGAVLTARDFVVEFAYFVDAADPARYGSTTLLRALRSAELARRPEFSDIFARRFSEISFQLAKGAAVEAVVDAIEALDGKGGLSVSYPSDCRECEVRVEGVDAHVRCTSTALEIVFPRAGAPAELIDAFAQVRTAFQIDAELAGLID